MSTTLPIDPQTERLAREVAKAKGKPVASIVRDAIEASAREAGLIVRQPSDADQAQAAHAAYRRYGKGIDPAARLNLCDCVAYALAKQFDEPLLFKGNDFAATDIAQA